MPAWLDWIVGSILGPAFQAAAKALTDALTRRDLDATHERAGADEAAIETQKTLSEIADARAALPDEPDDPDALARELRGRKSAASRGGGGQGSV